MIYVVDNGLSYSDNALLFVESDLPIPVVEAIFSMRYRFEDPPAVVLAFGEESKPQWIKIKPQPIIEFLDYGCLSSSPLTRQPEVFKNLPTEHRALVVQFLEENKEALDEDDAQEWIDFLRGLP